jgi:hypothetical protein
MHNLLSDVVFTNETCSNIHCPPVESSREQLTGVGGKVCLARCDAAGTEAPGGLK